MVDMTASAPLLDREQGSARPKAPVRHLHLGLGNFFRAHQAWYTEHAPDAGEWGIAAFTGRSAGMATALAPQDGLYTLVTRAEAGDSFEVVSSLSAVHPLTDHHAFLAYWRSPELAIVSLTVTEAGYLRTPSGTLDLDHPDLRADRAALASDPTSAVVTVPGRLVAGLLARRAARVGALTLLPCDNLPHNGTVVRQVVSDLIAVVDPTLQGWVDDNVSFATTMVDRITPATTAEDLAIVRAATGHTDAAPVATEPFSEWVIAGDFPAGRPDWKAAGASFVADVAPYEERKLALLNGSHSLLAYAGSILGHTTVADAIADHRCLAWVNEWWDEACTHLRLPGAELDDYRRALLTRFRNPNIRHSLAQIASDGSLKLPIRIVPTLRAEIDAGRSGAGSARVLAAWVLHLRGSGAPVRDAGEVAGIASGSLPETVTRVLALLGLDEAGLADEVLARAGELRHG